MAQSGNSAKRIARLICSGAVAAGLLMPLHGAMPQTATAPAEWRARGADADRLLAERKPEEALAARRQQQSFATAQWGPDNVRTLQASREVAKLMAWLGRFAEAQPLVETTLARANNSLGPEADLSLALRDDLASLFRALGDLDQADDLLRHNLADRQETIRIAVRNELTGELNFGALQRVRGRLAMAEDTLRKGLGHAATILGPDNDLTVSFKSSLAEVLQSQKRFEEAERLYCEAIAVERRFLPDRLRSYVDTVADFATLLWETGRLGEAEVRLANVLEARKTLYPAGHARIIGAMNDLAGVLIEEKRDGDAERLLRDAYDTALKTLGPDHRSTLLSKGNLGHLLAKDTASAEGETLMRDALARAEAVYGPVHPETQSLKLNLVLHMAARGRLDAAADLQQEMEDNLLQWVGDEYYASETDAARRRLVASQESYQDVALSLARRYESGGGREARLAASALLRFKNIAAEEEAALGRLVHQGGDPAVRALAMQIAAMHGEMVRASLDDGSRQRLGELARQLDALEHRLGLASRTFSSQLQVRAATVDQVERALSPRGALLEIRLYVPIDLDTGERTEGVHVAGVLIRPDRVLMRDLGPAKPIEAAVRDLRDDRTAVAALKSLHGTLIGPFAAEVAAVNRLYVAPDGPLYLVPFGLLQDQNGAALLLTKDVRLLQTGRDLLREAPSAARRGMVAMGGVDFDAPAPHLDATPAGLSACSAALAPKRSIQPPKLDESVDWTGAMQRFAPLPHSAEEATQVARLYCAALPGEPVELDTGTAASKARLMHLPEPPRALHLATHGVFIDAAPPVQHPLLQSGVALVGANAFGDEQQNGILYGQEVVDLDLDGTALVVLSACETAVGSIDYGAGLSGLVRAFRTAGAQAVMVALRPVGDASSAAFMSRFYGHWLGDAHGDAAAAMRATQTAYLEENGSAAGTDAVPPSRRLSATWSSFILVGP